MVTRKPSRPAAYRVSFYWIVAVDDAEKQDARDAYEMVASRLKGPSPSGWEVRSISKKKLAQLDREAEERRAELAAAARGTERSGE